MTASEFQDDKFPIFSFDVTMSRGELIDLLKEFALLKCAEQRMICSNSATMTNDYGSGGELCDVIDDDSIRNAPNPEM